MKWLTLGGFALGSCLLALAAYLYPWTSKTVDANLSTVKLAQIKTSEVPVEGERVITVHIPDSEEWRRLVSQWGSPTFIAGVASRLAKPELQCFTQTQLALTITDPGGARDSDKAGTGDSVRLHVAMREHRCRFQCRIRGRTPATRQAIV